jgi:hypothetical protein
LLVGCACLHYFYVLESRSPTRAAHPELVEEIMQVCCGTRYLRVRQVLDTDDHLPVQLLHHSHLDIIAFYIGALRAKVMPSAVGSIHTASSLLSSKIDVFNRLSTFVELSSREREGE